MSMNCQLDKQNKTKQNDIVRKKIDLSERKKYYYYYYYLYYICGNVIFVLFYIYSLSLLTTNSSSSSDPLMINDIKYSCTLIS